MFEAKGDCALDAAAEGELYRIAQQALTNTRQHARAKNVSISLTCRKTHVTLTIADDGVGLEKITIGPTHHGIVGMRERAEAAGGSLRITSRSGEGTRIVARVPAR